MYSRILICIVQIYSRATTCVGQPLLPFLKLFWTKLDVCPDYYSLKITLNYLQLYCFRWIVRDCKLYVMFILLNIWVVLAFTFMLMPYLGAEICLSTCLKLESIFIKKRWSAA